MDGGGSIDGRSVGSGSRRPRSRMEISLAKVGWIGRTDRPLADEMFRVLRSVTGIGLKTANSAGVRKVIRSRTKASLKAAFTRLDDCADGVAMRNTVRPEMRLCLMMGDEGVVMSGVGIASVRHRGD